MLFYCSSTRKPTLNFQIHHLLIRKVSDDLSVSFSLKPFKLTKWLFLSFIKDTFEFSKSLKCMKSIYIVAFIVKYWVEIALFSFFLVCYLSAFFIVFRKCLHIWNWIVIDIIFGRNFFIDNTNLLLDLTIRLYIPRPTQIRLTCTVNHILIYDLITFLKTVVIYYMDFRCWIIYVLLRNLHRF